MKQQTKKSGRKRINQKAFDKIASNTHKKTFITKREWNLVTPPGAHILRKYLNREFKVETLVDNSGWIVTPL